MRLCGVLLALLSLATRAEADEPSDSKAAAAFVNSLFAITVAPDATVDGLPTSLVDLVRRAAAQPPDADARLEELKKTAAKFEAGWHEYEARKIVVDEALAKAAALAQKGETAGAETTLRDVLRDAPQFHDFSAPVVSFDAELPAVFALAELLGKRKDWPSLLALIPLVHARDHVGAHQDELVNVLLGFHGAIFKSMIRAKGLRPSVRSSITRWAGPGPRSASTNPCSVTGSCRFRSRTCRSARAWASGSTSRSRSRPSTATTSTSSFTTNPKRGPTARRPTWRSRSIGSWES
jgi:hypothetical protein